MIFADVFCSFQRVVGLFCFFLQAMQKQTLGEVGTWTVMAKFYWIQQVGNLLVLSRFPTCWIRWNLAFIWWPVVSEMLLPKTIKIWSSVLKLQSTMSGMFFDVFLFISTPISCDPFSRGSAEAHIGWGGNLNGRLMASCVGNIRTTNY